MPPRRFSEEEVSGIVQRALHRRAASGDFTKKELMEVAKEAGLTEYEVEQAIAEEERERLIEEARLGIEAKRQRKFLGHLRTYLICCAGLVLLDLVTPGPYWFFWPMFGWGLFIAFHASSIYFPNKEYDLQRARRIADRMAARK